MQDNEDEIRRIADHLRKMTRRHPPEELPAFWRELPDEAQFLWAEVYRESQDSNEPAAIAWDRVREVYTPVGEGVWERKSDLPGYRESSDSTTRSWVEEDDDRRYQNLPPGSIALPGNAFIPESEVENLPEYVRSVYDHRYKKAVRDEEEYPHSLACTAVRSEYRKDIEGEWVLKRLV